MIAWFWNLFGWVLYENPATGARIWFRMTPCDPVVLYDWLKSLEKRGYVLRTRRW